MTNSTQALDHLEKRISELIEYCHTLKKENARLKQAIANVESQRSQLLESNESATEQVRQAIAQLEALGDLN